MNFLDENGLGRLWTQIVLKLNSKVPDGGTTGQVLKKTETGTEWADESGAAEAVQSNLDTHVNNTNIHVTDEEKSTWNAKLDSYTETDPTVPDWAKQSTKPTYTADEVGAAPASHTEDATVHVTTDEKSTWNESILIKNTVIQLPTSSNWCSIAYGNSRFVAVSDSSNNAAYSDDGITWTASTLPVSGNWIVTYGNGRFVAVAYSSNNAAYSDDGITWTASTLPTSTGWNSVAYGNGRFVAVTQSSIAAYSDDGINWITSTLPASKAWFVTYGNGRFVAVARNTTIAAYSDDGATWIASTLPGSSQWHCIAYGNGRFVTLAPYSDIKSAYSDDGITWTASTLPVSSAWRSIAYGNGRFVAVSYGSNNIVYSDDGINWTAGTLPVSDYWHSVAYGNSKFVTAIYGGVTTFYSYDGITWSNIKPSLQTVSGTDVTDDTKVILGLDKPITPESIGAATMTEVNAAIQTAIGNAIGGSY